MNKKHTIIYEFCSIFVAVTIAISLFSRFDSLNNLELGFKTIFIGLLSGMTYEVLEFLRKFLTKER
jgi:hypothetical protein